MTTLASLDWRLLNQLLIFSFRQKRCIVGVFSPSLRFSVVFYSDAFPPEVDPQCWAGRPVSTVTAVCKWACHLCPRSLILLWLSLPQHKHTAAASVELQSPVCVWEHGPPAPGLIRTSTAGQ